jgi:hypothetical protein
MSLERTRMNDCASAELWDGKWSVGWTPQC